MRVSSKFKIIYLILILMLAILTQSALSQKQPTLEVFSEKNPCPPCAKAEEIAKKLAAEYNASYIVYDIAKEAKRAEEYGANMGSVVVNHKVNISVWEVGEEGLEQSIREALGDKPLEAVSKEPKGKSFIGWLRSFGRHFKTGSASLGLLLLSSYLLGIFGGLNPCALGVFPVVVGYIAGKNVKAAKSFLIAILIGLGLTGVYMVFGLVVGFGVSFSISFVTKFQRYLFAIGGVVILVMGLYMMKLIKIPFLERGCPTPKPTKGLIGAVGVGVMLGLFYFVCVFPLLTPLLTYLISHPSLASGTSLLSIFGLGMSSPLIVLGLMTGGMRTVVLKKLTKKRDLISKISGGILVLVGVWFLWAFIRMVT